MNELMTEGKLKQLKRAMIVYKKVWVNQWGHGIAKLRIPAGARVVLFDGPDVSTRKCRASRAVVLSITLGKQKFKTAEAQFKPTPTSPVFVYRVGKTAVPSWFNPDTSVVCTGGIHFFRKRADALLYQL